MVVPLNRIDALRTGADILSMAFNKTVSCKLFIFIHFPIDKINYLAQ